MSRSVFDFENEDQVESPERLNEYIRVTNPGTWVLVSGLVLVLVAFIAWGFTGTIPQTVTLKGVVDKSAGYSLNAMMDAAQFSNDNLVGKEATYKLINGISGTGKVVGITETPLSREEIAGQLESDFLVSTLVDADYSYILRVEPEEDLSEQSMKVGQITIVTDEVKPISFLLH